MKTAAYIRTRCDVFHKTTLCSWWGSWTGLSDVLDEAFVVLSCTFVRQTWVYRGLPNSTNVVFDTVDVLAHSAWALAFFPTAAVVTGLNLLAVNVAGDSWWCDINIDDTALVLVFVVLAFRDGALSRAPELAAVSRAVVSLVGAGTWTAWDLLHTQLVVPTVVLFTGLVVNEVCSRLHENTFWGSTWAVLWQDARGLVLENVAGWAVEFLVSAHINASVGGALEFFLLPGVTDFFAFDDALFWLAALGGGRCLVGFDADGSRCAFGGTTTHVHALDLLVDAVAGGAVSGSALDSVSLAIPDTVDLGAVALFGLDTLGAFSVENHTFFALAALDASVFTWLVPSVDVLAGLWTSWNTWVVSSAAVALNWTELVASPVHMNTKSVTLVGIGSNGSTETCAIVTGITSTGVKHTVLVVLCWVDPLVAWSEYSGGISDH